MEFKLLMKFDGSCHVNKILVLRSLIHSRFSECVVIICYE